MLSFYFAHPEKRVACLICVTQVTVIQIVSINFVNYHLEHNQKFHKSEVLYRGRCSTGEIRYNLQPEQPGLLGDSNQSLSALFAEDRLKDGLS